MGCEPSVCVLLSRQITGAGLLPEHSGHWTEEQMRCNASKFMAASAKLMESGMLVSQEDYVARIANMSRFGGAPNMRAYSRLNWETLWYPTWNAAVSALIVFDIISRLASSSRSCF